MNTFKFNLQLFAEGGDGTAAVGTSGEFGVTEGADKDNGFANRKRGRSTGLENVIYGKTSESEEMETNTKVSKEDKARSFEELIKGEYKEEFARRTQGIIDERFKKTKGMEDTLRSHDSILKMLSDKYGVDASDLKALTKAVEEDESFYQKEAIEKGLTVEQLKEVKRLQRENDEFRKANEEAEKREKSQQIYAKWIEEGEQLKAKYGLDGFDFNEEINNPDFTALLQNGVSVEAAYMATHMDDMLGGAMYKTASEVKSKMAQGLQARSQRPSENGVVSSNSAIFKTDVRKLTKADRDEIERRSMRGETIRF